MVFSKEFSYENAALWRDFLTRNGAQKIYWRHQDPNENDYDNIGEMCPIKDLLCQGKLKT